MDFFLPLFQAAKVIYYLLDEIRHVPDKLFLHVKHSQDNQMFLFYFSSYDDFQ